VGNVSVHGIVRLYLEPFKSFLSLYLFFGVAHAPFACQH